MTMQYEQEDINLAKKGGGGGGIALPDFSVNEAQVNGGYNDGSIVLRTTARANATGAFTGGGTGNKALYGVFGFNGLAIGALQSVEFVWENVVGPAGPNFIPPGGATTVTPYLNLIVDFDPNGGGDIRVLIMITDQLAAAINNSVGTYVNNGSNVLTYSWDNSQNAMIVGSPPAPTPGGVVPDVSVGPSFLENSYKWSDLVSANPGAILVDAYPGDGGLPAGAIVPSILLVSGDSSAVIKSGKKIRSFEVNGSSVL